MQSSESFGAIVIVPAFNEEENIAFVLRKIMRESRHIREVVVVDDGSTDKTAEIAKSLGATVLRLEKNEGKANAVLKGLGHARAKNAKFAVTLDADILEFPEYAVERMILPLAENERLAMAIASSKELGVDFPESISHDYSGNRSFRLSALDPLFKKIKGHSKLRHVEGKGYGLEIALKNIVPKARTVNLSNFYFLHRRAFRDSESFASRQQRDIMKVKNSFLARKRLARMIRAKRANRGRVLPK